MVLDCLSGTCWMNNSHGSNCHIEMGLRPLMVLDYSPGMGWMYTSHSSTCHFELDPI